MRNLIANDGNWTPKQIHMLALLADPIDKRSDAEKCTEVGVTQTTLWRWKKKPGFIDKIHDISLNYLRERLPYVNYSLLRKAVNGDVQAMKLIYEILGKYNPTLKIQADVRMAQIEITKEMLDELAESIIRTKNRGNEGTGEERPVLTM